ncbi:MAG: translation initiation factor [Vicingaceae bacterium]
MSNKNKRINIVYSTNKNFDYQYDEDEDLTTLPPSEQKLRIHLDRLKGNKTATVVKGFTGTEADLKNLAKDLKIYCGVGGNAKNNEIILQGNVRDKVLNKLKILGYTNVKLSGG